MDCKLIHLIFGANERFHFSDERDAQIQSILEMGKVKEIRFEFITRICSHQKHPSQIYWCEIPILEIKCLGEQSNFIVFNNYSEVLFELIQPVIQYPNTRYISVLIDIRLPSWEHHHEFIFVINRAGNLLLIPSQESLSAIELEKIRQNLQIQTHKNLELKKNLKLVDIVSPKSYRRSDFRISFN